MLFLFKPLVYTFFSLLILACYSVTSAYAQADTQAASFLDLNFILQNALYAICIIIIIANSIYLCINYKQISNKNKTLESLAKDDITSLMSFREFRNEVEKILKSPQKNQYEIISLDIDDFTTINSYYGIEKSIYLIAQMGEALKNAYGKDNKDTLISRESAELFVICRKINSDKKIEDVVEKYLLPTIRELVGKNFNLNMSVGKYSIQNSDDELDIIINFAHVARIKGKQNAGISYEVFTEDMRAEHLSLLTIIDRMEEAFNEKEFEIVFQPRIDFRTGKINGAEALARWHPSLRHEAVFPDVFVPIMEKNNAIAKLDMYIFEEVCKFLNAHAQLSSLPKIAINFSAITLSNANVLKSIMALLEKYNLQASQFEIDLNEQALDSFEHTLNLSVKILKKIGFSVAMDDFGTSFASINKLSYLNVDIIKLDKAFINSHFGQPRGAVIVEEIIRLAKRLDMEIVAEGIETREQALWIQSLNSDSAQGYFFDTPLLAKDLIERIEQNKEYKI